MRSLKHVLSKKHSKEGETFEKQSYEDNYVEEASLQNGKRKSMRDRKKVNKENPPIP